MSKPPSPRRSHSDPGLERLDTRLSSDEGYVPSLPSTPPRPTIERTQTNSSGKPYSAFDERTKWTVAALGGVAAVFSPISSNIFVPIIPLLAKEFNRSEQDITLAVTVYLVCQAVTPSFFGAASDSYGRRPIFLITMVIYLGANIGLSLMPTSAYWLLLLLRSVQSIGGSAVISIGAGAVADIAAPRERGKYMAIFTCGAMIGPAIGPFLGGLLAQTLGWRSVFWFLTIATICVMVPFLFFYPETLRSIVGDGSIPPPPLNASPIALWHMHQQKKAGVEPDPIDRPLHKKYNPLSAFLILFTPELLIIFVFVSLPYLEFYCLLTVFSTALKDSYHLSELQIGLCYLPGGAGTITSALLNGKQLDWYYQREERRVGGEHRKKPDTFRLELTRIRCMYPFMAVFCSAAIALGWCLQARAPLAATLVMQFLVGLGTGTISTATIYGQDILPGKGGAVSASLNLVRCAFGALGTGVIQLMYTALGAGWTFVLLSGICVAGTPLSFVVIRYGKGWRDAREARAAAKRAKKSVSINLGERKEARADVCQEGEEKAQRS
ncbi:hypothetical protein CcaverHIS631_0107450 [Cutaneotrichosporon cavernicola]|nr:hypothetical protein CcaverHIS631_0107450 [Cutaneotrichosporon cavernicola]